MGLLDERFIAVVHLLAGIVDHRLVLLDLGETAMQPLRAHLLLPLGLLHRELEVAVLAPGRLELASRFSQA